MELASEIISKENIKPSSPTPPHLKTFHLSALDQLPIAPYVPVILYYPMNNGGNTSQALERSMLLKKSLSETLTQFYPLAGAFKDDFSIDCNDVGANFIVTLIHCRLAKFLAHPNHRLINDLFPFELSIDEGCVGNPVTNVQVNVFECGGIAIALCVSHKIVDGAALKTFLKAWTNMARAAEEVVYPNLTSPSLFPAKGSWLRDASMTYAQSLVKKGKCCTKRLVFGSNDIAKLRERATINGVHNATRVQVVSGLIWKCAIDAMCKEACGDHAQKHSSLSHAVNLRAKLKSSNNFIGNVVWYTNAASYDHHTPFHTLVKKVQESISKINVEFVEKAQGDEGYVELQKSLKEMGENSSIDNYFFTSWCRMGFYEIDFGWGKPGWVSGPILEGGSVYINMVILMDTQCGEGIEAWVNLEESEMEILKKNEELLSYAKIDPCPLSDGLLSNGSMMNVREITPTPPTSMSLTKAC